LSIIWRNRLRIPPKLIFPAAKSHVQRRCTHRCGADDDRYQPIPEN